MELKEIKDYLSVKKETFDETIYIHLAKHKEEAVAIQNELLANEIWCLETVGYIQQQYLYAFDCLRKDKYDLYFNAWQAFEKIEIQLIPLRKYLPFENNEYNLKYIETITQEFQKLFPYAHFGSREMIVKKKRCSICGQDISLRKSCTHIPGNLYMGKMCSTMIYDVEFLGLAIVRNPFDKFTVLFPEGLTYNYFMLRMLMNELKTPYDDWYVETTKRIKDEYREIRANAKCPCGSGLKYKKCCKGTPRELYDHHHIWSRDNPNIKRMNNIPVGTWTDAKL